MPIFKPMTRAIRVLLPVSASVLAAGCSADVARFEFPSSAGFADSRQSTNSIPIPPANVYGDAPRAGLLGNNDGASHQPPPMADSGPRGGDVRVAELPPTSGRAYDDAPKSYGRSNDAGSRGYDSVSAKPYDAAPRRRQEPRVETAAYAPAPASGGDTVEVKPGDTLYSLSRQHGAPVKDIMAANDLKGHSLKPGQRLTMPHGQRHASPGQHHGSLESGAVTPPASAPVAEIAEASPAAGTSGTYTMKPGDSLYAIARQHKVKYADLQRHNNITDADVRKIRPGKVLKIPGAEDGGTSAPAIESAAAAPAAAPSPPAESVTSAPAVSAEAAKPEPVKTEPAKTEPGKTETAAAAAPDAPKVLNAPAVAEAPAATPAPAAETAPAAAPAQPEQKVAALDTKSATDAAPAAPEAKSASTTGRLRWPVQGRVISTFGPRTDGTHNDGVNLSVPLGTDVHAAESGEVIYVGDELKAYGRLVLLRHDNGWVTAYAHNEELLVTRGKKVARGDVIAKAGKTGPVDQPQVHFELRQDSKAVDPTSFMEKL